MEDGYCFLLTCLIEFKRSCHGLRFRYGSVWICKFHFPCTHYLLSNAVAQEITTSPHGHKDRCSLFTFSWAFSLQISCLSVEHQGDWALAFTRRAHSNHRDARTSMPVTGRGSTDLCLSCLLTPHCPEQVAGRSQGDRDTPLHLGVHSTLHDKEWDTATVRN